MTTFVQLLRDGATIEALETHLNGLDGTTRREQVQLLKPADQARLYGLAAGRHTDLDHYVPKGTPAGVEVIHDGINTLPVIGGTFQKRFAIDPDDPTRICGYNHNNAGIVSHLFWVTGPGYFLVRAKGSDSPDGRTDHGGQVFVNYYEQPSKAPVASWPAPKPPNGFTAGLVWGQMCDYMWRVSDHVSIGTAFKKGKPMNQYFTLVRQ
jgi:hypothetical protein